MKKLIFLLSILFALNASAQLTFVYPVTAIDTTKPTAVDLKTVKIIVGSKGSNQVITKIKDTTIYINDSTTTVVAINDTTVTEFVNVETHAVDSLDGNDYAIIVRHHKIPMSLFANAFSGFDPETQKPIIRPEVLAMLLAPYNLKLKP